MADKPEFHCLVAGSGATEPRLRKMAEEMRLTNITFLGRWPTEDMTRLMSIGDVHLVSLRAERIARVAMPSKVPATLASGRPIIAAAQGEAASVVARAGAGWTCCPGSASELESAIRAALAAGPSKLRAMGYLARQVYESEFAMNRGVDSVERLLAGNTRRSHEG
jgi:glycosyltransferase involved in cell wall biosynthesis